VPLHFSKLKKEDLEPVVDKTLTRFAGWRGKLQNYKSRLIFLNSCIAGIPMYLLFVIKFPKWAPRAINSQMAHFLWADEEDKRKIYIVKWGLVCMKQEYGALEVQNLRDFNLCLLASWYYLDSEKIWRKIVDAKFDLSPNILNAQPVGYSPFWKGVVWLARAAKHGYIGGDLVKEIKSYFGLIF
jgi:hypothetical protein